MAAQVLQSQYKDPEIYFILLQYSSALDSKIAAIDDPEEKQKSSLERQRLDGVLEQVRGGLQESLGPETGEGGSEEPQGNIHAMAAVKDLPPGAVKNPLDWIFKPIPGTPIPWPWNWPGPFSGTNAGRP